MWKQLTAFSALALIVFPPAMQETKKTAEDKPAAQFKVPPEDAKKENPVKPTAESIARGKRTYGFDCAMCHGDLGDGKGDVAEGKPYKLKDFREPASLKEMTDGELFYIIVKGNGEMPAEGDRMKPEQVWEMVNYIRSLAKKETAPKPKAENP